MIMNKYSKTSDFYISSLISDIFNPTLYTEYCGFCNISAFKLMIDNNISLICRRFSNKIEWQASANGISAFNVSPYRAIAECFLLIKDEERSNEKAQEEV